MLDIIPDTESATYPSLSDYRPLHVYILRDQSADQTTVHLQLNYAQFNTYANVCKSVKYYWETLLFEVYPNSPVLLTNNLGAVIHKENWTAFISNRRPCLAWYGGESMGRLLLEIRRKKDLLSRQLSQLHVTEAILHYCEEECIERASLADLFDPAAVNTFQTDVWDPMVDAWDFQNHTMGDEYATGVTEIEDPGSLRNIFEQGDEPLPDPPVCTMVVGGEQAGEEVSNDESFWSNVYT